MKREFGVRQIGVFAPWFIIDDNHFCYKGKKYNWSDIISLKRSDDIGAKLLRFPSTTILLNDGRIIIITAILEEKSSNRFYLLHKPIYKYNEFINIIEKNRL